MALNFAVGFTPDQPREFTEWCRVAEDSGFERIGVVDSQSIYRELYVSCTVGLQATKTVKLGPRVTNPLTRHITVTASSLLTLSELCPERVFVAVGTGDSALRNIGLRPVGLSSLIEFTSSLRSILGGEAVQYGGSEIRLTWGKARIPIYIAAHGPKTLEVAGEFADGVIVGTGVGDDIVRDAFRAIAKGASRAGRQPESIDIWWHLGAYVGESREHASARIRSNLASKVNHLLRFPNQNKYVPPEYKDALEKIHREYNYREHLKPGPDTKNARLVQESGSENYLADRYAIVGTPQDCLETLGRLESMGVTKIWLNTYTEDNIAFLKRWGNQIIANLS